MIHQKITVSIIASLVVISMMITGCDSGSFAEGEANLESNIDSVSYAFGYNVGQGMSNQGMSDIEPELFAKGMQKALNDDTLKISQSTLQTIVQQYQIKAQQKAQQMQAEEGQINQQEGEEFLAENSAKEGVQTTESGLQYKILEEGSGASPTAEDTVIVTYTGTLLDGTEFDSNESFPIPLNRVIAGWTEGIQLMETGATYKFWIPGELAYGPNPRPGGPIGPNETLIFEVELIEIQ